jgi:hypothetical protein
MHGVYYGMIFARYAEIFPWEAPLMCKFCFALAMMIGTSAEAGTMVRFHFSAVGPGNSVEGGGSFSFADGLTTVGIGELTGFTFEASVFDVIHGGPQYFNYDPGMLMTFSATFTADSGGPALTSLNLSTSPYQQPDDPDFPELAFNITSLAKDGAFMERWKSGVDEGLYSTGTVTITGIDTGVTAVPEPSSMALVALGLACILRRKFAA